MIFKRSAQLKARFHRAVDLGLLLGGAKQITHLFGRQINRRYQGKLQTVLDRRDEGHPVLRSYYQTSFVKQYEKSDRLLRTETTINNYDLSKLRAKGLVERIGKTRRYRVTTLGMKLGTLLVKLRTQLLGPLGAIVTATPRLRSNHPSLVEAAIRQVDYSLERPLPDPRPQRSVNKIRVRTGASS